MWFCKQKQFTIFWGTFIYEQERWRSYTNTIFKTCYNSCNVLHYKYSKTHHWRFKKKNEIVATQAPELGQTVACDLFQASFLTREADNPMTGSDFDWMVLNHAVWGWKASGKASVSGVSLLQLSPFFPSIFSLFPRNAWYSGYVGTSHKLKCSSPPAVVPLADC